MSAPNSPPKPVIALRIGVTGHRKSRLASTQVERIKAQVVDVLGAARGALDSARERYAREYADADPLYYFVSALADGADTFAAQAALSNGWRLLAPLPFSVDDYRSDFSGSDREEFEALLNAADAIR